jgi:hypothetical protein
MGLVCFRLKVQNLFLLFQNKESKLMNSQPMVSPPYRGGGVWVLLRPWELCRR